jgi:hypothetical protein
MADLNFLADAPYESAEGPVLPSDGQTPPVPQATGDTLPGQAADLAGGGVPTAPTPLPVVTPVGALRAANYGDQGAQQYQALVDAGNPAQTPPPGTENLGGGIANLLGGVIAGGLLGDPNLGNRNIMAARVMAEDAQKSRTASVVEGIDFLNKLRTNNVPLELRAQLIGQYAASKGRQLTPAEASYIAAITRDPELSQHLLERAKTGDPTAIAQYNALFSGDAVKMVTAVDAIRASSANADKMVTDAETAAAAAPYAERMAAARVGEAEGKAAAALQPVAPKSAYQGTRAQAIAELSAEGKTNPTEADIGTRVADLNAIASTKIAREKAAAVDTSTTRTMKEKAPKVRGLVDIVDRQLTALEQANDAGVFRSRYNAIVTGKAGVDNPRWAAFATNAGLLSSLLANMHIGARNSDTMQKKFENMIGAGFQSPGNLHAILRQVRNYTTLVENAHLGQDVDIPDFEGVDERGNIRLTPSHGGGGGSGRVSASDWLRANTPAPITTPAPALAAPTTTAPPTEAPSGPAEPFMPPPGLIP